MTDLDWSLLADPEYVEGVYRTRQLQDAAAYGLGVAQVDRGPSHELLPEIARLEGSLSEYMKAAWHVLEPVTQFIPNWHLDAISEHLEAVTRGEITRLLINIPPGTMKSLSVNVFWMTWEWALQPATRWLFLSYAEKLCTRDSLKCRDLIESPWYQERWGHTYQLSRDQRSKLRFNNNRTGSRVATTMTLTRGEGGTRTVVDDPHNTGSAESDAERNATIRAWREEISTRLRDVKHGAKVVMMQRLHQQDLTGYILGQDDDDYWDHLMLPMRYDPARRCVTSLGFEDPRKKDGDWLWPTRFPPDSPGMKEQERDLGPYGVAGQWQQNPTAREGGQFERAWFKTDTFDKVPVMSRMIWVRHWDMAGTEGAGAYTCGLLMGLRVTDGLIFIKHVVRGQWHAAERDAIILQTAEDDAHGFSVGSNGTAPPNKFAVLYRAEQEPGSGGKDQARNFVRKLAGYRTETKPSTGEKFVRADPFAGAAKNGDVHVLPGPWREGYLEEMEAAGPGAAYLDQMDCSSAAYNRLQELWDRHKMASPDGMDISRIDDDSLEREPGWRVT